MWQIFRQNIWVVWVVEFARVMITRFKELLQALWLIGHSWSLKITNFQAPNKYFMSGKARCVYMHTLTVPVYKMGQTNLVAQPVSLLRTKLWTLVKNKRSVFLMKHIFLFASVCYDNWNSLFLISIATIVKRQIPSTHQYHSVYGYQTWQDDKLPWLAPTHKVTQPFDHLVLQDHMTNQNYYNSTTCNEEFSLIKLHDRMVWWSHMTS